MLPSEAAFVKLLVKEKDRPIQWQMKRRTNGEKSLVKKEETSKGFKDKDTKKCRKGGC